MENFPLKRFTLAGGIAAGVSERVQYSFREVAMRQLKIGTSSVRGVVGESLTPELLAQFDAYQPPRLEDWLATLAPPGAASGPA